MKKTVLHICTVMLLLVAMLMPLCTFAAQAAYEAPEIRSVTRQDTENSVLMWARRRCPDDLPIDRR